MRANRDDQICPLREQLRLELRARARYDAGLLDIDALPPDDELVRWIVEHWQEKYETDRKFWDIEDQKPAGEVLRLATAAAKETLLVSDDSAGPPYCMRPSADYW